MDIICDILKATKFRINDVPKIKGNDASQVIQKDLFEELRKLKVAELKRVYAAAHFLNMENLRKNIATMFAAMVFIELNQADFIAKKQALGITKEYDPSQFMQELSEEEQMLLS